ncbi:MAG TPA: transglycosylase SLT domain-containing protein [Noviherbaspirillum sp.]|uniref:transglycosylase SLT domain-containing protein n=1 Tax=Noviherbaspirillum sp. TaxID=1926288 RepID=UPI002B47B882|nr:transglycosylase SLT domain-containing protein [Noviherbaspirillum sp.]HJV85868.1 transglycosylase SLT domain-containing protein [Noviherbaspirillum sp.]
MLNRFIRATFDVTRKTASQSAAWAVFARDTVSGFITTAHHTLLVLGIVAIAALGLMFVKPEIADQLKELSPFAEASADDTVDEAPEDTAALDAPAPSTAKATAASHAATAVATEEATGNSRQQQWVTSWLSKRYRVATDATNMLVSAAYMTAKEIKLDPLLILSVMAIESGFNPFAESPVGAQGLMQVMAKVHHDKFAELGGVKAALNPVANIRVGSLILKDYVTRGGSVEAGLKLYVGAGASDSDSGYGAKVLAEYRRLKEVAMGKKVPAFSTSASSGKPRLERKTESAEESAKLEGQEDHLAKADQIPSL